MKERPISYSPPMVRARRAGRKTQTRRSGAIQSDQYTELGAEPIGHATKGTVIQATYRAFPNGGTARWAICECPYGIPGDRLWIREEHYRFGHWEKISGVRTKTGRQKWRFVADSEEVRYGENPPETFRKGRSNQDPQTKAWHKRLARFMPRRLSRSLDEIVSVRVERLQAISEEDAQAEGIATIRDEWSGQCGDFDETLSDLKLFEFLWESINGEGAWALNSWVWVVTFRNLTTT